LDGLRVQVHAVEVVLQDLTVEIEEGAMSAKFLQPGVRESDAQAGIALLNGAEQAAEVAPNGPGVVRVAVLEGVLAATKSGSSAVSLKSSARAEAMRPAQCWSLGRQSPTPFGRLKARTYWRMTSGWRSGSDSRAIGIYDLRLAIYEPRARGDKAV
jgi:hypothetical protein